MQFPFLEQQLIKCSSKEKKMNELKKFIDNDRFARHIGVDVIGWGAGWAKARMTISASHLNSAGTVHGGAIFSLADAVFSIASNSHGTLAMAINVSISFFKAVRQGSLTAEGKEVSKNHKLATYLIEVKDDENDTVALFQGTVYRKKESIAEIIK